MERLIAALYNGRATQNKEPFDVIVGSGADAFGISVKSRKEQPRNRHVLIELSNASATFRDALAASGIDSARSPRQAARAVIDRTQEFYNAQAGKVNVDKSRHFMLTHDTACLRWNIYCFPLSLDPVPWDSITWEANDKKIRGLISVNGRDHVLWDWYFASGGQLKYSPLIEFAEWQHGPFTLEEVDVVTYGDRIDANFPARFPDLAAALPGLAKASAKFRSTPRT